MADLTLTRLSRRSQLLLFVTLVISAAVTYYVYLELPIQQRLAERQGELINVRSRINKGLTIARQLPEVGNDVDTLRARLDSLERVLPGERDAADLLRQVHTLAMQSDLTIHGFRPKASIVRTLYAEWPIDLELEGTYHNLGEFLDRISKFPRIITIGNLVMRGKQSPLANATVDIACTATTFVLLDDATSVTSVQTAPPGVASLKQVGPSEDAVVDIEAGAPARYVYRPDGRRDPFVSLARRAADGPSTRIGGMKPDGLAGVLVHEITVRGLIQSRGAWIAIVESANGRAYSIRSGDRLLDGSVLAVTKDAVVLRQDAPDPLSLTQQREVRKYLRGEVH